MRGVLLVGSIVALGATAALVASLSSACWYCGDSGCVTAESVQIELSCPNSDLASVRITGVCASVDGDLFNDWTSDSGFARDFFGFGSLQPGACHFDLTFASGFTYSGDVTFSEHAPECHTCPSYLAPSQGTFVVDNPSSTCLGDGGEQ